MPRLTAVFEMLCVHGPVKVDEMVIQGKKIDKKTGEEKNNYVKSGKKCDQYTFMCGSEPITKEFPDGQKGIVVGKTYRFDKEVYLQYVNFSDAVVTEIVQKKEG